MWNPFKKKAQPSPTIPSSNQPHGRRGLLDVYAEGGGLLARGEQYYYQVEVVEDFGDIVRIKVVDVHTSDMHGWDHFIKSGVENSIRKKREIRWLDKETN